MEIKTGNQTEPNPIWRPLTSHNIAFHSDSSKKRAGVVCWRPSLAAPLLTTRESSSRESRVHRPTDRRHLEVAFGGPRRESNDARSGRVTARLPRSRSR